MRTQPSGAAEQCSVVGANLFLFYISPPNARAQTHTHTSRAQPVFQLFPLIGSQNQALISSNHNDKAQFLRRRRASFGWINRLPRTIPFQRTHTTHCINTVALCKLPVRCQSRKIEVGPHHVYIEYFCISGCIFFYSQD